MSVTKKLTLHPSFDKKVVINAVKNHFFDNFPFTLGRCFNADNDDVKIINKETDVGSISVTFEVLIKNPENVDVEVAEYHSNTQVENGLKSDLDKSTELCYNCCRQAKLSELNYHDPSVEKAICGGVGCKVVEEMCLYFDTWQTDLIESFEANIYIYKGALYPSICGTAKINFL